jgi:hypothetical protein
MHRLEDDRLGDHVLVSSDVQQRLRRLVLLVAETSHKALEAAGSTNASLPASRERHGAFRLTEGLRALVAEEAPEGYLTVYQTMRLLRVPRQTVWQRVKHGG